MKKKPDMLPLQFPCRLCDTREGAHNGDSWTLCYDVL